MRFKELEFAGLDIESTSSNTETGGLIQIGVYFTPGLKFSSDVRPLQPYEVSKEAMKVNGFTMNRIQRAESAEAVDHNLRDFLDALAVGDKRLVAIGWNVGSFDLPFVRRFLPLTFKKLSYRTVDLNAVCFTLDPIKWERHKKAAKAYAKDQLTDEGWQENWHDASYDAAAAYHAWHFLRQAVNPEEVIEL